jgi:hypothetical protein
MARDEYENRIRKRHPAFLKAFGEQNSDMLTAIIGAEFLHDQIKILCRTFLVEEASKRAARFTNSFDSCINLAISLGLVDERESIVLQSIKTIRNSFSHTWDDTIDFSTVEGDRSTDKKKESSNSLIRLRAMIPDCPAHFKAEKYSKKPSFV